MKDLVTVDRIPFLLCYKSLASFKLRNWMTGLLRSLRIPSLYLHDAIL